MKRFAGSFRLNKRPEQCYKYVFSSFKSCFETAVKYNFSSIFFISYFLTFRLVGIGVNDDKERAIKANKREKRIEQMATYKVMRLLGG